MMGPAQFIAGWLYGISDQTMDKRDAIVDCFTPSHDLMKEVYHAMNQYIKGNKDKGDEAWEKAIELYKPALANCDLHSVTEPLNTYKNKMSEMVADPKWSHKELPYISAELICVCRTYNLSKANRKYIAIDCVVIVRLN